MYETSTRLAERARLVKDRYWTTAAITVGLLVVWELIARFDGRSNNYFPTIEHTIAQTADSADLLISGLQTTMMEVVAAFLLAMTVGVVLGVIFSEFFVVRQMLMPMLIFAYALPAAIIAPLFVIWFGIGPTGVAVFGGWVAVFPVFVNTLTGLNQTEEEFYQLSEVYGATEWQQLKYIKLWKALPHVTASAKIAVQSSIVGVVVGEFLASGDGLGFLIVLAAQQAQLGFVFGTILVLIVFAIAFFNVVSWLIDRITPDIT